MHTPLYHLKLGVPGNLGKNTKWTNSPTGERDITQVHIGFDETDIDPIFEIFPGYFVLESLASALRSAALTGLVLEETHVSWSEFLSEARSSNLGGPPPQTFQLRPQGVAKADFRKPIVLSWSGQDVCRSNIGLIVTQRFIEILHSVGRGRCIVREMQLSY